MHLTIAHLKALIARPECRDDMVVTIENLGPNFTNEFADAARISDEDELVITVTPDRG